MYPKKSVAALAIVLLSCIGATAAVTDENKGAETAAKAASAVLIEAEIGRLHADLADLKSQYETAIAALQARIEALEARQAAPAPVTKNSAAVSAASLPNPPSQAASPVPQQGGGASGNAFNPNISVIADFLAAYARQSDAHADDMVVREVELGLSGNVDTWGRYDLTLTFAHEPNLELSGDGAGIQNESGSGQVEEGYFTFLTLPGDLQARVGQFRNRIGKSNSVHPHSLPWTDYPLAIQRYLGGEGMIGTGVSLSWLAPFDQYTELTYELFKVKVEDPAGMVDTAGAGYSHLAHLNTVMDLTDTTTLELGGTSLLTPADPIYGTSDNWLNSADVTLKWVPLADGTFRRFEWRSEVFGLRRSITGAPDANADADQGSPGTERATFLGLYSSLSYRFDQWWDSALLFDYAEGPFTQDQKETAVSAYLTWWQSEFAYWRLGLSRGEMEMGGVSADPAYRLSLQFNISLGPHPAHKY